MLRFGIFSLVALFADAFAQGVLVAKGDFPRFAGVLDCRGGSGEECPGAKDGFVLQGLAGEAEIPDPTASELTAGGRLVVGFLEGKPFAWPRYSVDFPNPGRKWVVLNELSANDQNRVFLSLWRQNGPNLGLVRVFPRFLPLSLGETTVHAHASLPDGSKLVILKGDGADAGVRLQDYRVLRLSAPDRWDEVHRRLNRSEIPVNQIMEKLNADQAVEAVRDSTLDCEVAKKKAPSGGPLIRFTTTRNRVLYTKGGPVETPEGKSAEEVDIWNIVRAQVKSR